MASNTPKLGLYMKDPVADGNDFFDVKTMMNDNWEKIDGFAGGMDEVKERLNTISRQDVTLQPGVQVINVAKSALFQLSGLTGRMLVNSLGRMGNCENVGLWSSNTTIALDTSNKTSGTSSFKLTLGSVPATASVTFLTVPGKKYIAIADVKNGNTSKVAISINGITGAAGNEVTSASAFAPSVVRFVATDYFHIVTITGTGASGNTFNMDSVRVYEVSDTDYAAAATLTPAQVAAKWPYVDSVMPARNPYAIRWTDATKTAIASMLAIQTDLYADPVTWANPDTVFERDGQYFKNKNWNGLTLDGNRAWVQGEGGATAGVRQVKLVGAAIGAVAGSGIGVKFDGKLLPQGSTGNTADSNAVTAAGDIYFGIPIADSGWADSYGPTPDDIKAYFFGYKAYDANTITPANAQAMTTATWNGTGTKYWVQRVGAPNFTQSVPQQSYAGYTPYQLVYQLATPVVEPIISEGQLSFVEGDNQVEVGTGIVLRESAKATYYSTNGNYYVNNTAVSGSLLKNMVSLILKAYCNSQVDNSAKIENDVNAYGKQHVRFLPSNFDSTAAYSVTYLMLDPSPVAPFMGSYAANEKTLLADLVDSVQQNTARVSVLENKKADQDNPAWLTPTLLNGWTNHDVTLSQISYLKDSAGYVHIKGIAKPGAMNTNVFQLPAGYRPSRTMVAGVAANTDSGHDVLGRVNIGSNGNVAILAVVGITITNTGWVSLDSLPPFLAEQ